MTICSAKGCRSPATTDLRWRNPRLHDASRVKHWLACDEHAGTLADFLGRRGFLLGRDPFDAPTEGPPDGSDRAGRPQPPIADIDRSGCTKPGSPMP